MLSALSDPRRRNLKAGSSLIKWRDLGRRTRRREGRDDLAVVMSARVY